MEILEKQVEGILMSKDLVETFRKLFFAID